MTTQEKIEVMQAYVDGKQIEVKSRIEDKWRDCVSPWWDWNCFDYRIKPEPTYRPYNDVDEMIADFKERFSVNVPNYVMPLIWVKPKNSDTKYLILVYEKEMVVICDWVEYLDHLFDKFTYLDGSPVGKI